MWGQKAAINVSAPEGISGSGSNQLSIQDKKIFESTGEDSGFLSGPQNSCDSLDSEIYSHQDIVAVREPVVDKFIDSGVIEEGIDDVDQEDNTKDRKQDPMIVQMGVEVGLSESMCGLNLNNLNSPRKIPAEEESNKFSKLSKQLETQQLWQICYNQDGDGDTQLHLAILGKYVEAVWAIIRLAPIPAFLDIRNDDAHSPLHLAVLTRQPDIVRCLLLAGAKATVQDSQGNTPLHLACMNCDKHCVNALTAPISPEERCYYNISDRIPQVIPLDLEQRNYDGIRVVHIAAQQNDVDILRHLVWLGADINAREGKSGYTALHLACEDGNEKLAHFMLSECTKLDVEARTYGLLTAYQLAVEINNRNLMANLESHGAEVLSLPISDDEYFDSSEDEYEKYESDDCELN